MTCAKCGYQLPEGAAFCSNCGEAVSVQNVETEPKQQNPEETVVTADNAENTQYDQPTDNDTVLAEDQRSDTGCCQPPETAVYTQHDSWQQSQEMQYPQDLTSEPQKKRPNKRFKVLAAVAAFVVAAAVLAIFNAGALKGFALKTFGSSDDYFRYVEDNAFEGYTDEITSGYGSILSYVDEAFAGEAHFKLNVGEDTVELLEKYLKTQSGMEIDLDFLDSITIDVDANSKKNLAQIGAVLSIDDQKLADIDTILDMEKMEAFVAVLNLSEKYLSVPMDTDEFQGDDLDKSKELAEKLSGIKDKLPKEKELERILDKYLGIVMDNISDVSKDTDTVKVGDVEQKLTVLEFDLDTETLMTISKKVLEEAKSDRDLEKYINDISEYLEQADLIEEADEIYDRFKDAVDDALDSIEYSDAKNEKILTIVDYINSKHEIVGREIDLGDSGSVFYIIVKNGKDIATKIEISDAYEMIGQGTESSNKLNMEYKFNLDEQQMCTLTVENFDTKKIRDGYLNGTFTFIPSSAMLEDMGLDEMAASVLSFADPAIVMDFEADKKSSNASVNIVNKDEIIIGFTLRSNEVRASDISLPASSDTIDAEDAELWLESADFDKLISALEKTTLPKDLIESIEQAVKKLN